MARFFACVAAAVSHNFLQMNR